MQFVFKIGAFNEIRTEFTAEDQVLHRSDSCEVNLSIVLADSGQKALSLSFAAATLILPIEKPNGEANMVGCQTMQKMVFNLFRKVLRGVAVKTNGNRVASLPIIAKPIQQDSKIRILGCRKRQADDNPSKGQSAASNNVFEVGPMILLDGQDMLRMDMEEKAPAVLIKEQVVEHVNRSGESIQAHDTRNAFITKALGILHERR